MELKYLQWIYENPFVSRMEIVQLKNELENCTTLGKF